ncbi:YgaP family membrane protein [Methanolobus halotolerans]|uniref:DUF2892 domain-containing protein n=1 Tax=Methanolobus halotolerans TaxID=2052935 RepID=A0A4E0Q2L9_9EURY|nr:DUF2892 domain-containing protein [Methanolobus halotolerans]TGC11459.1 DUF2892 domain-containing protein [Methanolobus halotolerans]
MDLKEMLFKENVGGLDLYVRALLGSLAISALALGIMRQSKLKWLLALVGFTGIFTSLTRHCTPYTLLGISTAKKDVNRCHSPDTADQEEAY